MTKRKRSPLQHEEMNLYYCMRYNRYEDLPCDEFDKRHNQCFKVSDVLPDDEEE